MAQSRPFSVSDGQGQKTPTKISGPTSQMSADEISGIGCVGQRSQPPVPGPLRSFYRGLQQRQLDTIAFFLKSNEPIFEAWDAAEPESVLDSSEPAVGDSRLEQLVNMLQLVLYMVQENTGQLQLQHFTEQVLHLVQEHLQKLTRTVITGLRQIQLAGKATPETQQCADRRLTVLTDYLEEVKGQLQIMERLRQRSHNQSQMIQSPEERRMGCVLSNKQRHLVNLWDSLESRAVTVEGILTGELSLLQKYLLRRCGSQAADLTQILETGLEEGLAFMHDRDLASATNMFVNMGFDPDLKLRQICMYTVDHDLRDYLISELQRANKLTVEEQQMVQFVQKLESQYSCSSYFTAKLLREEGIKGDTSSQQIDPVLSSLNLDEDMTFDLVSECGDLVPSDVANSETSSYSRVILEWVRHWSDATRNKILLEHRLTRKDSSCLSQIVSAACMWEYLCCHLDVTRLQQWLHGQYSVLGDGDDSPSQVTWPYDQPITKEMLEHLAQLPHFMKERLTDDLSRRGVFVPWELRDLEQLMQRLSKNAELFQQPHLVNRFQTKHSISLVDIHYHIINWCIDVQLPQFLYFYLDYYSLCEHAVDLTEVGISSENLPLWVTLLLTCRLIAGNIGDPQSIYNASLLPSLSHPSLRHTSVRDMLDHSLVIEAVATLAYSPEHYQQFVQDVDNATVQMFSSYPQLQHAMFGQKLSSGLQTAPLTVYNLLVNNGALSVSRLFGWQKTHTLVSDECPQTLPSFSYEPLVAKYGHHESIGITYYLRQGRPCSAFCVLLSQILQSGARTLPHSRIHEACTQSYLLATNHFSDVTVSAACVAFIEMLGVDAMPLRLHLEAATNIKLYFTQNAHNLDNRATRKIQQHIALTMLHCLRGNVDCQLKILTWLTGTTYWKISKMHADRASVDAGLCWQLVHQWCTHYNLPLSTHFITDCALQDNWQLFLTFAQIYNYPTEQLLIAVKSFPSVNLRQHLLCVLNAVYRQELDRARHSDAKTSSVTEKARKSKSEKTERSPEAIGVEEPHQSSPSKEDNDTTRCEDDGEMASNRLTDLLGLLRGVQNTSNPVYYLCTQAVHYKNPLLSVLAACYQEPVHIECVITWFLASLPPSVLDIDQCFGQWSQWSADTEQQLMADLRNTFIDHSLEHLLHTALSIFSPDCHLLPFLEFIRAVREDQEKAECLRYLHCFKQKYHKSRSVSSPVADVVHSPLFSARWIEETVARVTRQFLASCQNISQSEMLLKCLDELSILRFFECNVIDISLLLKLHQVTRDTGVAMDYVLLGSQDHTNHKQSCDKFISSLLDKRYFCEARLVSEILGMPDHAITIEQLKMELQELQSSDMWSLAATRVSHWMRCQELMEKHQVTPAVAARYFLDRITLCSSHAERARVYEFAYNWLHKNGEDHQKHEIFLKMWQCKIHDYLENQEHTSSLPDKSPRYKLCKAELLTLDPRKLIFDPIQELSLSPEEEEVSHKLIGQLLNNGCLSEVQQVIQHFGCVNTDFNIILNCLQLAKGQMKPEDLGSDMKKIASWPRPLRLRRISTTTAAFASTLSMVNVSSLVNQCDTDADNTDDRVRDAIQTLSQNTVHAKHCAAFILTSYNIARLLSQRFDWVLMLEDFALIHRLLASQSENRYILAKGYIITAGIEDTQVAGFLCDAIVEALQLWTGVVQQVCMSYGTDKPILLQPNMDRSGLRSMKGHGVQELLQLCVHPAVLGTRLLDTVTAMVSANTVPPRNVLTVEVELLVYAHDCFTLSCHMEGISSVLKAARYLAVTLTEAEEFILMISMLLGLARYNEMSYIFDILKQQHQFELLFRKGMDRDVRLRLAILDYLHCFHADDIDTYSMAALNFTMYREIARMLEDEAHKELNRLKDQILDNTGQSQSILKKALHYFSDAAESYAKENCFRQTERCVRWARLVALQTQLLSSKTNILHLHREAVQAFVSKHTKFYEAYIVCEVYNCHSFWADMLYHQVIKAGSTRYLQDLRNHVTLTPTCILEVAQRYCLESQPTKQMTTQMKKLLVHCHDLATLHKITTLLGFHDVARDVIKSDAMNEAYLKDMGLVS